MSTLWSSSLLVYSLHSSKYKMLVTLTAHLKMKFSTQSHNYCSMRQDKATAPSRFYAKRKNDPQKAFANINLSKVSKKVLTWLLWFALRPPTSFLTGCVTPAMPPCALLWVVPNLKDHSWLIRDKAFRVPTSHIVLSLKKLLNGF